MHFIKDMVKLFIFKTYFWLFFCFLLNAFECLIFSLGSNESEAEEDEVEKPQRKKRTGRKKAPTKNQVGFFLITSDCTN